jgi:hypothetical protein
MVVQDVFCVIDDEVSLCGERIPIYVSPMDTPAGGTTRSPHHNSEEIDLARS